MAQIKAVIGLGNPGSRFERTRHNIGFRILDCLAQRYRASWRLVKNMEQASIALDDHTVTLVKPQTFMNNSGQIMPALNKSGINADNILVVHDELELPFGVVKTKDGGSARGHNGIKSMIAACGADFKRVRFGIDRPEDRSDVPDYVLQTFRESPADIERAIDQAADVVVSIIQES